MNWRDGSLGKGVCCQPVWPEFGPWDPHVGVREPTHAGCLLSDLHSYIQGQELPSPSQTNQINVIKKKKKRIWLRISSQTWASESELGIFGGASLGVHQSKVKRTVRQPTLEFNGNFLPTQTVIVTSGKMS